MFSSRGMCQVRRTGVFEDVLQVKNSLEVNQIAPLKGSNSVNIDGYSNVDDFVVVNINLFEGSSLNSEVFVADREYEVISIKIIHRSAGQAFSNTVIRKVTANTTPILAQFLLDGANDTVQSAILPVVSIDKNEGIRVQVVGDISGLSGCVITVVLKQL